MPCYKEPITQDRQEIALNHFMRHALTTPKTYADWLIGYQVNAEQPTLWIFGIYTTIPTAPIPLFPLNPR